MTTDKTLKYASSPYYLDKTFKKDIFFLVGLVGFKNREVFNNISICLLNSK